MKINELLTTYMENVNGYKIVMIIYCIVCFFFFQGHEEPLHLYLSESESGDSDDDRTYMPDCDTSSDDDQDQPLLSCEVPSTSTESPSEPSLDTFVNPSNSKGKQRDWKQVNYCLYCEQKQAKLRRHCLRKHSNELLVAQAVAAKELDPARADQAWQKIINRGNMKHNQDVHAGLKHDLVVRKRPAKGKTVDASN